MSRAALEALVAAVEPILTAPAHMPALVPISIETSFPPYPLPGRRKLMAGPSRTIQSREAIAAARRALANAKRTLAR